MLQADGRWFRFTDHTKKKLTMCIIIIMTLLYCLAKRTFADCTVNYVCTSPIVYRVQNATDGNLYIIQVNYIQ